jgi:hypothetical protein
VGWFEVGQHAVFSDTARDVVCHLFALGFVLLVVPA